MKAQKTVESGLTSFAQDLRHHVTGESTRVRKAEATMRQEFQRVFHREMMADGTITSDGWAQIKAAITRYANSSKA